MAWYDRPRNWLEELVLTQEQIDADPGGAIEEGIPFIAQELSNATLAGLEGLFEGSNIPAMVRGDVEPSWDLFTNFDPDRAANAIRARGQDPFIQLVAPPETVGGVGTVNLANWAEAPIEAAVRAGSEAVYEATESPLAAASVMALEGIVPLPGRGRGAPRSSGDVPGTSPNMPALFSGLEADVSTAPNRQRPDQWAAWVQKGGHSAEARDRGLTEWLATQETPVSREDVLGYLELEGQLAPARDLFADAGASQMDIRDVANQNLQLEDLGDGTFNVLGGDGSNVGQLNVGDGRATGQVAGVDIDQAVDLDEPGWQTRLRGGIASDLDASGTVQRPDIGVLPLEGTRPPAAPGATPTANALTADVTGTTEPGGTPAGALPAPAGNLPATPLPGSEWVRDPLNEMRPEHEDGDNFSYAGSSAAPNFEQNAPPTHMDLYTVPLASGDTASFTVDYMPEDFEGELGLSPHITQYDIEGNVVDSYPLIEYLARSDSDRYVGNSNFDLRLTPAEIDEIAEQVRDEFNLSMDEVESTQGYDTMVGNTGFNEAGFTEIEGFYDNPAAARATYQSENDNLIVPAGLSEDASTGGEIFARPRVGDGQWQYFELGTNPEGDTGITVFDAYGDGTIEVNDFFAVPNVDTDNMAEAVDQYLTTGAVDTSANQTVVEGVDQRYVGWPADQEFQRLMPGDTDAFPVPPDARVNTMGDLNSASRSPAGTTFVPFNEQGSIDSFVNPYESNEWFQSDIYETEIALFNTDTNQVVAEMPMLPLDREGLEFVDGEYGGPLDELARAQVQPVPSTRSLRVSANEVVAEMDGTLHADGTWISDAVPDVYGDGEPAVYAIPSRQMGDNRPLLYTYWDGEDMDAPQIQIREQDQNFDWNVDEIVYLEDLDMTEDQLLAGGLHNYVTSNYEVARQERQQAAQAPLAWEGPVERKTPRPAHSGYSTGVARGYGERALLQPGDKYYGDRVHLASITDPETGRAVSEGLLSMSREGWGSAVGEERMWLVDEIQSPRQKAAGTHGWWDDPRGPVEEAIAGIMGPIDPSRMSDPEQQAMRQVLELQEKRVPPTPMREGGRWVEQQTKRGLRDAVSRNADIFGWNTAENITDRWGTSGALFNKIYDQVAPKMKLWKRLGVKPERMTNNAGREVWGVRLTPELKERLIKEGIPYYTLGGMAILGSQYGEEEEGMLFSPAI